MDDTRVLPARRKLDVHAYYALAEAGVLGPEDRVELIDGEIIDMAPIGESHASTSNRLTQLLVLACRGRAVVAVGNPVRLDPFNEPQPDFAILRLRDDFYAERHPGPADTLLLIELSDSTLRYDRRVKRPLYARAGIPEYWIVNLKARTLLAYRGPGPDGYAEELLRGPGDRLALLEDGEIVVPLDQVFSRA